MIRVGEVIHSRYEVQQRVGMGGMADVYKAMDRKLNRYVAIKVLKPEFSSDKSFVAKFQAEARAAAGLSHPNIVSVYDVSEEGGSYFIVMELIEGITLKQYIEKKGKLSIQEATSIAIQVSTGIEAAHQNNIIHRDIKPQNIIISKDGKVKIADFGIAKAISANTNTISSNVMGSVHYSSPEQSRGGYLDAKSDLYSLGIVMFEMVTGRVPFDGDTTVAVAIQHLQEEIKPPSLFNPEVPISLEKIILKCTAKSPAQRYAGASFLIKDLKQSMLTPNVDFVTDNNENGVDKTVLVSKDELNQIKGEANRVISKTPSFVNINNGNDVVMKRTSKKSSKRKFSDDIDDEISPKSEKIMGIITIVAAIAIIVIVIMIIFKVGQVSKPSDQYQNDNAKNTNNDIDIEKTGEDEENDENDENNIKNEDDDSSENQSFRIPNVLGKNLSDARILLEDKGLIVITKADDSQKGIANTIISQKPIDMDVIQGDTVTLTYIPEKEKIDIPKNLIGMTEEEVMEALKKLNINGNPSFEYSDEIEAGKVINTSPSAGSSVEITDTVTVFISKGPKELKMPNLIGLKKKVAIKKIKEMGLILDKIDENVSAQYKEGVIIDQSIKEGTLYKEGESINITISLGIQDTQEDLIWMWAGTVSEPDDYTGSDVKIVLEQTDGANIKSKNLWEDKPFDFDGHRFAEYALIPGVDEGKLYIYEKSDSGNYGLLKIENIKFKIIN